MGGGGGDRGGGRVDGESMHEGECGERGRQLLPYNVIGTILNEPQTSKTALHMCMCMPACLQPFTVNFN